MAAWTQSQFLQALGWATLNSLWQMALLWAIFSSVNHTIKLSASRKYQSAVGAILIGFVWFVSTAIFYYQNHSSTYAFFQNTVVHSNNLLHICLLSASVTYLFLLAFPAIRLFRNWQFVQRIKKDGQQKAQLDYRLFVQKVSFLLGITKKVKVVVSTLVSSPVTVGYLKPVILLPVAAMNNLNTTQVEAILLHELSHIRRYDYLLNFVVCVIHTLLYFNPFVKSFINVIEAEREACCDEVVLQFGYDKVGYASALLHLEKTSGHHQALALAAAGKQNLLTRIEKIVGMEKKKTFKLVQVVPLFMAMFCVLLFNSVLIIKDAGKVDGMTYTNDMAFTPLQLNLSGADARYAAPADEKTVSPAEVPFIETADVDSDMKIDVLTIASEAVPAGVPEPTINHIIPVNFDAVDGSLDKEEKEKVQATVETAKKVASTLQWKEIEASIADVMDKQEKAIAKQEYLHELEKVQWDNMAQNLKVNFDKLDWDVIDDNIRKAESQIQLDSLQTVYAMALAELEKTEANMKSKGKCSTTPMPDASIDQIKLAKEALQKSINELKAAAMKKNAVCL